MNPAPPGRATLLAMAGLGLGGGVIALVGGWTHSQAAQSIGAVAILVAILWARARLPTRRKDEVVSQPVLVERPTLGLRRWRLPITVSIVVGAILLILFELGFDFRWAKLAERVYDAGLILIGLVLYVVVLLGRRRKP